MKIKSIEKNKPFKYEYGCLMVDPTDNFKKSWLKILNTIDKQDIYNINGFGVENNPHVTVLFGFNDNKTDFKDIEYKLKEIKKPFTIKIKGISCFENKDYDVLKFDIESDILNELNSYFKDNFDYHNDYPNYHPHLTVSYLKKGCAKKYMNKEFAKDLQIKIDKFVYSRPDETKIIKKIPIILDNQQQNIKKFDDIIGEIIKRLKLPNSYTIKTNEIGKVYSFNNHRSLKITTDEDLAKKARQYVNKVIPNTKNVFKVYKLKRIKKNNKDIYLILFDNLRDSERFPFLEH